MRDLRDLHLASRRIARRHRVRIATYFRLCNRSLRILMDLLSPHELRQQIASGLEQLREREWLDQEQPGEFEPIVVDLSYVELPDFDDDLESDVLIWS
ncbi:uncharacterized protein TRIVIDRAFT_219221 [Trichoderma virens Gv29-8]|uniref:Uncharacterized protein n=1 Tax=Hypocrea virens (strain Gv29-8 / FGSC 10586) TaxID=413071 RepID=G9MIY2_HYPVG|nr:uncharacterized protein TRIVIDRAFT_219221 [Trichoderma virens Gv29-8]EHK25448.1 hypothetical protein TRIVIDRAFT_219221 [Trichoderma virens Gv29-8]UKZ48732.1 hypothetical protein TrVGV298_002960 [Trichoderma virens]UKZ75262.1 hypothetical protein TrVFT333_002937 [Trichoderma virens FT-333]